MCSAEYSSVLARARREVFATFASSVVVVARSTTVRDGKAAPEQPATDTAAGTSLGRVYAQPFEQPLPTPSETVPLIVDRDVDTLRDALDVVRDTIEGLVAAFLTRLPLVGVGLVLFVAGLLAARWFGRWTEQLLERTRADRVVVGLSGRIVRFLVVVVAALMALSVAGVRVGAVLATLGIAGLALAFALQNILENFVSGIILLVRKPFRAGDQIETGDFEGTVEEIDLRVTRLVAYDGVTVLIPNSDVFRNPLSNMTRRGSRRTTLTVGVDYRDDHDRARQVLMEAVTQAPGVLAEPMPEVLLTELGDFSVDFELRYWTLPDIRTVRRVQDRVLSDAKSALERAGLTIPWPIRTLMFDTPVELHHGDGGPGGSQRTRPPTGP